MNPGFSRFPSNLGQMNSGLDASCVMATGVSPNLSAFSSSALMHARSSACRRMDSVEVKSPSHAAWRR